MLQNTEYCKEFKNGNITIKYSAEKIKESKRDSVLTISDVLSWLDCYFIGETYCLSNYETGHTIYNYYSDTVYVFPWRFIDALERGETVRLYAQRPDETDREILETEAIA